MGQDGFSAVVGKPVPCAPRADQRDAHGPLTTDTEALGGPESERPDKPEEACGVFAVLAAEEAVANLTYFGLYALQHRGQE